MTITIPECATFFALPENLAAAEPPEARGLPRSGVKLLVIDRKNFGTHHSKFEHLGSFLNQGDLLVFNSSRTLPALLLGRDMKSGKRMEVRLAEHLPDDSWLALLLCREGELFDCASFEGMWVEFGQGLSCTVYSRDNKIPRLWRVRFSTLGARLIELIYKLGRPRRYEHVPLPWSLDYYQNVYARLPGSSELPSAGRAFTWKMLFDLKRAGIDTESIVLHAGLSSYMDDDLDAKHPMSEEEYTIAPSAARKINAARSKGNRVVAVGTTVVRALESAVCNGAVSASHAYTRLHITRDYNLKSVDGLLTGFHEPHASHLDLLQTFLPENVLFQAYQEAIKLGYLWHEFGDLNLIV